MSRSRKRRIAIVIAAAIVIAGGAVASVSVANAVAAETARQCSAALKGSAAASATVSSSIARAAAALDAAASTALPGTEGWKTTRYADRPARAEVKASPTGGGVAAVAAKPARPSGADLIGTVSTGRDALAKAKRATTCADRDAAVAITAATRASNTAAEALDRDVAALTGDFADFQAEERTRLAADAEAARKRAEEEAARKKAEEAAAAEEAARQAAAEQAARSGDSDGSTRPGDGGGSVPQQPGGGSGGGSVGGGLGGSVGAGSGDNNGWCQKSNGMGGTTRYRC